MKKIIFFAICFLIISFTKAQIISTIAGDTIPGYTGDNGLADSAKLNHPLGVAVDTIGNVYIADSYNNAIRKINTAGIITTIAGNNTAGYSGDNGLATLAQLNNPTGVAVDLSGNVYVADSYNQVIRKISSSGIITTFAGNNTQGNFGDGGQATAAQLTSPQGVATDNKGNVYIADTYNSAIRKVNINGVISLFAGNYTGGYGGMGGIATSATIGPTFGVAVDRIGNVYIALGTSQHRICKVDTFGIINIFAGQDTLGESGEGGPAINAKLTAPVGVAADTYGNVYIADYIENLVHKVNTSGIITILAGDGVGSQTPGPYYSGDGGPATAAEISMPMGVASDKLGNVYIADDANNAIRKVSNAAFSGINQIETKNGISIYPNPSSGIINITSSNNIDELKVTDLLGQLVYEVKPHTTNTTVSLDNSGVYFVTIHAGKEISAKKLIVNK